VHILKKTPANQPTLVKYTLINYNRAGIPLLEIVSGPDLRSAQEAAEYAKTIRGIVQYLDVCDGNLEEGSLAL
jgi:aspartyl-tRNA(Asn)/glutamyl-tRNA(Gln) amidotransferase subunit B